MKKFLIFIFSVALLLSGCGRSKEPNAKRGTKYEFDIVDFIEIETFGQDGNGYIEVTPKEITAQDFYSDEEYIKVKKDLDAINPYCIPGSNSTIQMSKYNGLSNGEIVVMTFKHSGELSSDMNIEPYEYVVNDLTPAEELDLFSEEAVTFFATEKGQLYAKTKKGYLPDELVNNLNYIISTNDALEANKSVLSIEATMNSKFLEENKYYDMGVYLAKNGYTAKLNAERVLKLVVSPDDISTLNSTSVENALYEALYELEGDNLLKVNCVQQTARQETNEPYTYLVIYCIDNDGTTEYMRRNVEIYNVEGEVAIENIGRVEKSSEENAKTPYEESKMIYSY